MALKGSLLLLVRRGSELDYVEEKVAQAAAKEENDRGKVECLAQEVRYKEVRERRLKTQGDGYACEMQKKNTKSGRKFLGLALQTLKKTPRNLAKQKLSRTQSNSAEPRRSIPVSIASGYFIESKSPQLGAKYSTTTQGRTSEAPQPSRNVCTARVLPKIVLSKETPSNATEQDFSVVAGSKRTRAPFRHSRSPGTSQRSASPELDKVQTRFMLSPIPRSAKSENELNVTRKSFRDCDNAPRKIESCCYDNFNTSASLSALPFTQRKNVSDAEAESRWGRLEHAQSLSDSCLDEPIVYRRVDSWMDEKGENLGRSTKPRPRSIEVFLPSVESTPS